MVLIENELKNAYIGEVYEYSYTFKGKTSTQIGNEFTKLVGTIATNTDGVYGNTDECRICKTIPSLATAKKITVGGTVVVNSSGVANNAAFLGIGVGIGWGTGMAVNRIEGSSYGGCNVLISANGTGGEGNSIGNTVQGTYTHQLIIDLENKTLSGTVSGLTGTSTLTLTDSQISGIRDFTYLLVYVSGKYSAVSDISITIE